MRLYKYTILLFDAALWASAAETNLDGRSGLPAGLGLELSARAAAPVLPLGWSSTSRCMTDVSTGTRALAGNSMTSFSLTLDQCVDFCDQTGFQYAGAEVNYLIYCSPCVLTWIQYGSQCYCSNAISTANGGGVEVAASECSMNCAGNCCLLI